MIGQPATAAFWTSSNESRPLTQRIDVGERQPPVAERPADDLVERVVAADVLAQAERARRPASKSPVACRPPVAANAACASRSRSGSDGDERQRRRRSGSSTRGASTATASSAPLPQTPHDEIV